MPVSNSYPPPPPPPPGPYPPSGYPQQGPGGNAQNLAIIGLVLGIFGLCCGPLSIGGVILGYKASSQDPSLGLATAAKIVSIVTLVLWVLWLGFRTSTGSLF